MFTYLEMLLIKYLLILFRCTGFFTLVPIFGRREMPLQVKVGLAALLSFIIYPMTPDPIIYNNLWIIAASVIKEQITGLIIAFPTFLLFSSLYVAGKIIDMEMGFGMVNVLDPNSNTQVPLIGNYYYIITVLLFLAVDGHHILISALMKSFELLPPGAASYDTGLFDTIVISFKDMFILGIKVALPIISLIFLTDLALGIIARTVPQMNVFMVGIPIKIAIGMIAMILSFPMYTVIIDIIQNEVYKKILHIISEMWVEP